MSPDEKVHWLLSHSLAFVNSRPNLVEKRLFEVHEGSGTSSLEDIVGIAIVVGLGRPGGRFVAAGVGRLIESSERM